MRVLIIIILSLQSVVSSCKKEASLRQPIIPERQFPPVPRNTDLPLTLIPTSGDVCLTSYLQLQPYVQNIQFVINEITLDDGRVIKLNGPERVFSMKFKLYYDSNKPAFEIGRASFYTNYIWTFNNNGSIFDYPTGNGYNTGIEACSSPIDKPMILFKYRSFLTYSFKAMIPFGLEPNQPKTRHIVMLKP